MKLSQVGELAFGFNSQPDYELFFEAPPHAKERHMKSGRKGLATRVFEDEIITQGARDQWEGAPLTKSTPVLLVARFGITAGRGDTSNYIKSLEDGLQGIVFANDKSIEGIVAVREESLKPFIDVQIWEV